MTTQLKYCSQCKRKLGEEVFYYNSKDHKTCFSCYKRKSVKKNICEICGIRACFNYPNETFGIRCKKDSTPEMIDIKHPRCIICKTTRPTFNYEGEAKATHCGKCADPEMINVKNPKCIVCKTKQPTFNYPGETKATHCKTCAHPEMINVKSPRCIVCKTTQPTFNYEGETKATHCKTCAHPEMINVKDPKCIVCKTTRPTFNYEGETKATHCKTCAHPEMINVKNPKCIVCKTTQPTFNYEGETKATHCGKCADPEMINVKSPRCIVCKTTQPTFNYEGEAKATHCGKCADPEMINVKSPKCIVCKTTRAGYGIPCNRPTRCAKHKEDGMISNPSAKCLKKDCNNTALYGINKPIHCEKHKVDNDIYLVERKCDKCGCIDVLYNGLCVNVCIATENWNIWKRRQKVKETRILNLLTATFGKPTEYNVRVDRNCGKQYSEEKEIGYDCGKWILFIEVDENQHKSYCETGEINRMKNIYFNEGGINIIFIRYNPDGYKDTNGKKVNILQSKREELLIKWVKYYKENEPKVPLGVRYLFYDGCPENGNYIELNPY
jgi:hypothetical protein